MSIEELNKRFEAVKEEFYGSAKKLSYIDAYNDLGYADEKEIKIIDSVLCFKASNYKASINDISTVTGISSSSVQRYLNNRETITTYFGDEEFDKISEALVNNRKLGRIKGGIKSFINNSPVRKKDGTFAGSTNYTVVREKNGHFAGSISFHDSSKLEKKKELVESFVTLYLNLEDASIKNLSLKTGYSEDFIYDCLTSKYLPELFDKETIEKLRERLASNSKGPKR